MPRRAAIAACSALLLGLLIAYGSMLKSGDAGLKRTDFITYYSAARLVADGHGDHIFDFGAVAKEEAALVYPLKVKHGVLPYLYAPYFAVALVPLAVLPYAVAYLLWLLLNCAVLALVVYRLQRYANLQGSDARLFWIAGLAFLPVFVALAQGQVSIMLLGFLSATFFLSRSGRSGWAGLALAPALVKAPYVVPILLVFAARREWRALVSISIGAAGLLLLPMAVLGVWTDAHYFHSLTLAATWHTQIGGYEPQFNHNLAGFTGLLLPSPWATLVSLAVGGLALLLLVGCARSSNDADLAFALAVVVAILVTPHVLVHDLVFLLLPAAVVLRRRQIARTAAIALLAGGYGAMLVGFPLVGIIPLQLSVLVMVGLSAFLLAASRRSGLPGAPTVRLQEGDLRMSIAQ
jgi:alpha-1,2-mannosyltransferase